MLIIEPVSYFLPGLDDVRPVFSRRFDTTSLFTHHDSYDCFTVRSFFYFLSKVSIHPVPFC